MAEIVSNPNCGGQGFAWWFRITLEDHGQFELLRNPDPSIFTEVTAQLENSNGHFHIQGMVRLVDRARFTTFIKRLTDLGYPREFIQVGRLPSVKDVFAMRNYCQKEDTRVPGVEPVLHGQPSPGQAKEKPQEYIYNLIKEVGMTEAKKAYTEMIPMPKAKVWRDAVEQYQLYQEVKQVQEIQEQFKNCVLRPWQADLIKIVESKPDSRSVYCIYDKTGGAGKTWLCKYLKAIYPDTVVLINNGKSADLSHIMAQAPNAESVLMSLQRNVEQHVNYQAIEQFKDNCYTSTKYHSTSITGSNVHFIVFTNFPMDWASLTEDRWIIWRLDKNGTYQKYSAASFKMQFPNEVPQLSEFAQKRRADDEADVYNPPKRSMLGCNDIPPKMGIPTGPQHYIEGGNCPLECHMKCCYWRVSCPTRGKNCDFVDLKRCKCQAI